MVIGIIGAGASGMAAAIHAAQKEETEVLLLERQARVGRKLQATGNGRCNLSNLHALEGGYHGEEPDFPAFALNAFPPEKTRGWFRSLGLLTVAEPSGRVYPFSDQANSVVDVLRFALDRPNIRLAAGAEVTRVKRFGERFRLETGRRSLSVTSSLWPVEVWRGPDWGAACLATRSSGLWAITVPSCGLPWCS